VRVCHVSALHGHEAKLRVATGALQPRPRVRSGARSTPGVSQRPKSVTVSGGAALLCSGPLPETRPVSDTGVCPVSFGRRGQGFSMESEQKLATSCGRGTRPCAVLRHERDTNPTRPGFSSRGTEIWAPSSKFCSKTRNRKKYYGTSLPNTMERES